MGFIEETGAAQHLRDARILPIYEGTNGIQARDLVGRKVAKDGGETMLALVAEMRATAEEMKAAPGDDLAAIRTGPAGRRGRPGGRHQMGGPVGQGRPGRAPWRALCPSCGWPARRWAAGCWPGAPWRPRASSRRATAIPPSSKPRSITARFYAEVILPPALAQLGPLKAAGRTVFALSEAQL